MPPRYVYDNPNYAVEIKKRSVAGSHDPAGGLGDAISGNWERITATLPEEIEMRVAAQYEAQLANFLSSALGWRGEMISQGMQILKSVTGDTAYWQGLTQQLWLESDPFELNLTLNFDADTDAVKDVMKPTHLLQSWVLPTAIGDFAIESPAPTIYNADHNRIVVHIGRFMTLPSVVIPNVDVTYPVAPDANGNFIAATASLTLRTSLVPHRAEFMSFFSDLVDTKPPAGAANLQQRGTDFFNYLSRLVDGPTINTSEEAFRNIFRGL